MPRIATYEAPASDTRIEPSNAGYSAMEMAGRRLGPLYQQQAADVEKGGRVTAALLDEEKAPLEFSRFHTEHGGGGGFRVIGDFDSQRGQGGSTRGSAQMTRGAPLLSDLAKGLVSHFGGRASPRQSDRANGLVSGNSEQTIDTDPDTGGYINYKKNPLADAQAKIAAQADAWPGMDAAQQASATTAVAGGPTTQTLDPSNYNDNGDFTGGTTMDAYGNPLSNPGSNAGGAPPGEFWGAVDAGQ